MIVEGAGWKKVEAWRKRRRKSERFGSYGNVKEILKRKREDLEKGMRRNKIMPRSSEKGNGRVKGKMIKRWREEMEEIMRELKRGRYRVWSNEWKIGRKELEH